MDGNSVLFLSLEKTLVLSAWSRRLHCYSLIGRFTQSLLEVMVEIVKGGLCRKGGCRRWRLLRSQLSKKKRRDMREEEEEGIDVGRIEGLFAGD